MIHACIMIAALMMVWFGVCEVINAMSDKTLHMLRLAWIAIVLGACCTVGELLYLRQSVPASTVFLLLGIAALLLSERRALARLSAKINYFKAFIAQRKAAHVLKMPLAMLVVTFLAIVFYRFQ